MLRPENRPQPGPSPDPNVQITVERPQPCQARVTFTVPAQEFELEFQKALREVGRKMRLKGYRPGHVPPEVVARFQGKELRQEVAFKFVNQAYQQAIADHKLRPLAHPQVNLGDVLAGVDFGHAFELSLRPDFELGAYNGLAIASTIPPVMPEEIEQAIEQAARNQAHPEPAGDDGLPEEGMALCKVELLHGDAVVWEREGLRLSPKATVPGVDSEAFKVALLGKKDGETAEVAIHFPADFEKESAREQDGVCRVSINQAFRIVVPTRDELKKSLGIEDEAELVKRAKEGLEKANRELEDQRIEGDLLERLIAGHEMELPALMVEEQHKSRLAQARQELQQRGLSGDALEAEVAKLEGDTHAAAIKGAKAYFLIERIAEAEKLQVAEAELIGELRSIAKRNRSTFEEVRDFYKEQNLFPQLAMEILERKVRRFLREAAKIEAEQV